MYRFQTPAVGLTVCLHDEAGRLIGTACFHQGNWQTDDKAEAEAMLRAAAADGVRNYRIVCVEQPQPVAAPVAKPQPTQAPRPRRHRKED